MTLLGQIATLIGAYLLGGIPTAYLAGRLVRGIDIRDHGSGNVGATNAVRVLGWRIGIPVLLADILKGVAAVLVCRLLWPELSWMPVIGGVVSICGHIWTVFLGFKGGKGVATSTGVFLALSPVALGVAAVVFVLAVFFTRYISVGSMAGAVVFTSFVWVQRLAPGGVTPDWILAALSLAVCMFIIARHRINIVRLLNGTECKIKFRSGPQVADDSEPG